MKSEVLFFYFEFGLTRAIEKAKDRQITVGVGRGIEMICDQELNMVTVDRAQLLWKKLYLDIEYWQTSELQYCF